MTIVELTIDGQTIEVDAGMTILEAARSNDIYIPALCGHPDLPPVKGIRANDLVFQGPNKIQNFMPEKDSKGCGLCIVEIKGKSDFVESCSTEVKDSMVVTTTNENIKNKRKENLVPILSRHQHACLTCAQQEGCSRSQCSINVPENERCCKKFGHCEFQDIANYIGISDSTPKWMPTDLPLLKEDPLFERDYNLCIGCTRCVRACRDFRGIEAIGFVYDKQGLVQVGSIQPTLSDSGCKFCTACVEVCPTGAIVDKSVRPGKKDEDIVPCKTQCPVHIDIPGYLRFIAQGKKDEAIALIREKVPIPGILGRSCTHPCEQVCRRQEINAAISICALKRFAADSDQGAWKNNLKKLDNTGKRIAVVGSGPAGLTTAFYLRKQGHFVTIFEKEEKAGGMMRYGIPDYRLPPELIDQEINQILDLGIDLLLNKTLGKDFTIGQLKEEGFDAVFLALGAQLSRKIHLEGCDLPDVLWGIDFLRRVSAGENVELKENIAVIGGGNVAVDVAMTALRSGALNVSLVSLESEDEAPASPWEINAAIAEGVKLLYSFRLEKILSENDQIIGLDIVECTCVFDEKGIFSPELNEGSKECLLVDQVLLAVGQVPDLSFLDNNSLVQTQCGLIVVDERTLQTGMLSVYAGGDATKMPGTIIHAVAAGRKAASAIDKALGGDGDIQEILFEKGPLTAKLGREEGFAEWKRELIPEISLNKRHQNFKEIFQGYTEDQARREAKRCLQCDLRLNIKRNPSPPYYRCKLNKENLEKIPETGGVYQLFDDNHKVLAIKGTTNLRWGLFEAVEDYKNATLFKFEEVKMYSQRENELIQKYAQEYGQLPGAGGEDDLF